MRLKGVPKNYPIKQETISCKCGCGAMIERYYLSDQHWHERQYIHNHHRIGKHQSDKQKLSVTASSKTRKWKRAHKGVVEKRRGNANWIESTFGKKAIKSRWNKTVRPKTYFFCTWCNAPFVRGWSAIKNPNITFCCNDHKYNYFSGDRHRLYSGGTKQYPRAWTRKLRTAVRNRDGRKCLSCGDGYSRSLIVHHIDEDKNNCKLENLITLCRSCHMKVHAGTVSLNI